MFTKDDFIDLLLMGAWKVGFAFRWLDRTEPYISKIAVGTVTTRTCHIILSYQTIGRF